MIIVCRCRFIFVFTNLGYQICITTHQCPFIHITSIRALRKHCRSESRFARDQLWLLTLRSIIQTVFPASSAGIRLSSICFKALSSVGEADLGGPEGHEIPMNSVHFLAKVVMISHKQLRLLQNTAHDGLQHPTYRTTYFLSWCMLYRLSLQGCIVG